MTVGRILRAAFELYRRQVRGLWAIVALIAIPAQVLGWVMIRVSLTSHARVADGVIHDSSSAAVPTAAILLLGFLSGVLAVGALSRLLGAAYVGQEATWQDSLGDASTRLGALVILAVVWIAGVTIGITMFALPAIFLAVAWSTAVPALMLERTTPLRALSRSWELIRGFWWRAFGALLVGLGVVVGVSLLLAGLPGAVSSSSVDTVLALAGVSRALGAIITYPLLAAIAVVIYVDLCAIKEHSATAGVGSATP